MNKINQLEMKFLAIGQNEAFARSAIAGFCVDQNPTLEEIAEIKTAVSEAVTNCIVHAYEGQPSNFIVIIAQLFDDNSITIEITDFGVGIPNIELAMQPAFTSKPEQERSGMGFTLMSSFMDEMRVLSSAGKGTSVFMRKKLGKKED